MNADELRQEAEKKKEKQFRSITKQNLKEIQTEQELKYIIIVVIVAIIVSL